MKLNFSIANNSYQFDTDKALSIAIPLQFNGAQPNHFGADIASKKVLKSGTFTGDTTQGGSCNVEEIRLVPHCNGTHTESISHIVEQQITIGTIVNSSLASCALISVAPTNSDDSEDSYIPSLVNNEVIIDASCLQNEIDFELLNQLDALVIRTLPNNDNKLSAIYHEDNQFPFFSQEAMEWIAQSSIKHLLVDFPSVDQMYDEGHLTNHHIYWNVPDDSHQITESSILDRTITEMVFVNDDIVDGLYCLNLQVPAFELDAAPSRPILYPLTPIKVDNK